MATRTISNTGGNWNAVGTWVEGAVPTSADDVVATATSGNVTITPSSVCKSINFTNYAGVFTFAGSLSVSNISTNPGVSNVRLGVNYNINGTPLVGTYQNQQVSGSIG